MGLQYPGLTIGFIIAGAIVFLPIMCAIYSCRRDVFPSWCFIREEKKQPPAKSSKKKSKTTAVQVVSTHQKRNRKQKTLDLPPGGDHTETSYTNRDMTENDEP